MKKKEALLLIDIQNDYFPGGAMELVSAVEAGEKTRKVLAYFRENNLLVIHIKHIALQEGADFFLPDTLGVDLHESVYPSETEKVVVKNYPNSFRDTELLIYLREHQVSDLVICGMMTDVCVDATVRAAMDYGFSSTIISDAVATRDRELYDEVIPAEQISKSYLAGLNALGGLYADIKTCEQYLEK
ncbi:nicotinamidase-related amidase [Elizabethkingia sp. YR214]|uniref:cysteine hydrolase family protein n=1 Tax=Elizabethkingia sp. YR214 TaxID=2135667 RepID=UPI000D31CB32|nr:cysteine hydrolase family protein [Elizabethkingia sp. YR214]PUB29595.1 nicotinamidase-related amidase [Elizabethkingia sp. YR214]